jgi:hypothetical protein
MLQYQKNTLLNLLLQFEMKLNDEVNDFENTPVGNWTNGNDKALDIIKRNVQSIKKQINSL